MSPITVLRLFPIDGKSEHTLLTRDEQRAEQRVQLRRINQFPHRVFPHEPWGVDRCTGTAHLSQGGCGSAGSDSPVPSGMLIHHCANCRVTLGRKYWPGDPLRQENWWYNGSVCHIIGYDDELALCGRPGAQTKWREPKPDTNGQISLPLCSYCRRLALAARQAKRPPSDS